MLNKVKVLWVTVRYLKLTQIKYQILYRLKKPKALHHYKSLYEFEKLTFLTFKREPPIFKGYLGKNHFAFLNVEHIFKNSVDWSYQKYGKLWNYNLQYANYILQDDITNDEKLGLIRSLYKSVDDGKLVLEPYPVSLRSINLIRFLSKKGLRDKFVLKKLYAELDFLSKRLEYHLLGNHLLENGFALMMGGGFFGDKKWFNIGLKVVRSELEEQIHTDGGHFELSPMYHQIILFRLLELIDWYADSVWKEDHLMTYLLRKAQLMCGWLKQITFSNGDIPHFNDSTYEVAYSTEWLVSYAMEVGVIEVDTPLGASGYRSKNSGLYECRVDVGQVGPSYQPGHAHADALSFILYYRNNPLLVEAGTSTYKAGTHRTQERATKSHNTVSVNNQNQSEVYGAFRVGRRAKITIVKDEPLVIQAQHNGYVDSFGVIHKRTFFFSGKKIGIVDELLGNGEATGKTYFHLAKNTILQVQGNTIKLNEHCQLNFENSLFIEIEDYNLSEGFNKTIKSKVVSVAFKNYLKTSIIFQ